jgi:hypothetical protein
MHILADKRKATHNSTYQKGGISHSKDSFVVNQSLVLRINLDSYRDGENRYLRQAWERYASG